MTQRILVTGAAGTIGRAVVAQLAERADAPGIVAFDRDTPASRRALAPFAGRATLRFGDITRDTDLAPACDGVDAVIHLAAIIPPLADDHPELAEAVNLGGTRTLIATLEQRAPSAFLVFASSVSVYGDRLDTPEIRVDDPLVAAEGDAYAKTKIAAEAAVRASRLDWSIIRLTAVMGGHKMSPLMFHMPLDTPLEIATVQDAARALAAAPDARPALTARVFNLGGGPRCRTDYRSFLVRSFATSGLGAFDLPEAAFATRNFHCGLMADGDDLEAILHFRRDDLEAYFAAARRAQPWWQRVLARLLRRRIKTRLVTMSEPLQALEAKDREKCARFFGPHLPDLPA